MTSAVSGVRRAIKELVDGTIRVQIDIEPRHRKAFFDLFPDIDAPVAIAPLMYGERPPPEPVEAAHRTLGPLALLAVQLCRDHDFQAWVGDRYELGRVAHEAECKAAILDACKIGSRRELDTVPSAAAVFHEVFRKPFHEHMGG